MLPLKFNGFVTALTTKIRPTPLMLEEFSSMIMEEEMGLKARNGVDEAYVANTKDTRKRKELSSSS